ncbi:hypothetical protein WN48_02019 [Eufriesea mexicana]|uniref:Uncharacterized protein n=1 Tax=Eufriesea mexicana TaxID=516756 RepID=A0A310SCC7_9HYME|nr:hypothetical protein WN48_02019 [Eufriesea mexicana]
MEINKESEEERYKDEQVQTFSIYAPKLSRLSTYKFSPRSGISLISINLPQRVLKIRFRRHFDELLLSLRTFHFSLATGIVSTGRAEISTHSRVMVAYGTSTKNIYGKK